MLKKGARLMALTGTQVFFFFLRGCWVTLLPVLLFVFVRKRYGGRLYPVLIGAAAMVLLAMPRALMRGIAVQGSDGFLEKFLASDLIGAFCEEIGRFIAMKIAMQSYDTLTDAHCYGIGHGGVEAISAGFRQFALFAEASALADGSVINPERLEILSRQGFGTMAEICCGEAVSMLFHMAMSVLVFTAVRYGREKTILSAAVLIHAAANLLSFFSGSLEPIFDLLFTVGLFYAVYRVYTNLKQEAEDVPALLPPA